MTTLRRYGLQILMVVIPLLDFGFRCYEFFLLPDVTFDIRPGYLLDWVMEPAGITTPWRFIVGVEVDNHGLVSAQAVDIHIKNLPVAIGDFKVETDRFVVLCGSEEDSEHGGPGYAFLKCSQPDLVPGYPTVVLLVFNRRIALDDHNIAVSHRGLFGSGRFAKAPLPLWRRISRLWPYFVVFGAGWASHRAWSCWHGRSNIASAGQSRSQE